MKSLGATFILFIQVSMVALFLYLNFGVRLSPLDRELMAVDHLVFLDQTAGAKALPADAAYRNEVAYGRALYRRHNNLPDAVLACLKIPGSDCGSGAFIEYVKQTKSTKLNNPNFVAKLEEGLCLNADGGEVFKTERRQNSCYIYLGQSLLELKPELESALELCGKMKSGPAAAYCAGGVYRRWFMNYRHTHFANKEFDLHPCDSRTKYIYACIKPKISFAPKRWTELAQTYAQLCEPFGEQSRECHRAFGASLFFNLWKSDLNSRNSFCRQGSAENQEACFQGAVEELIRRPGTLSEALQLCDRLDSENQRRERCRELLSLGFGHSH